MKKYTLEQWQQIYCKEMKPTFEGWLFLGSFLLMALCYDLEHIFSIELGALSRVSTILVVYSGGYYLCWILATLVFAVLVKIKQHKQQKQKEGKETNDYENK